MKLRNHTKPHEADLRGRVRLSSCDFVAHVLLSLLLLVPGSLNAQSGRKRPDPAPPPQTPNAQRPQHAGTPPAPNPQRTDLPGQPATPDEQRGVPAPTPSPVVLSTNDPTTGQVVVIDPDEVIRVNSNLVPIPASVVDDQGRAVSDLEVKDFELLVDGQPRPIGDVSRAETPVRLALLFDNSLSLHAARELEKQSAMRFFRTVIRPVDQAAIFSIWTEPVLEQPLTSDVNKLVSVIDRYGEPDGATALFDTVVQAADYLRPQTGRKVIVIVSDGIETASQLQEFNQVLRRVQAADIQVYVVQSEFDATANLRQLVAEQRMKELTAQTGGAVFNPKTTSELPAAFAQISADLAQQYVLSYYPEDDRRDARYRVISLRVKTRTNVRVRARRGYYPHRNEQTGAQARYTYNPTAPEATALTNISDALPDAAHRSLPTTSQPLGPTVGPSYGSKNLNPDGDDVPGRRVAPQLSVGLEPAQLIERVATTTPPAPTVAPLLAPDRPPPAATEPVAPAATSDLTTAHSETSAGTEKSTTAAKSSAPPPPAQASATTTAAAPPVSGVLLNGRARKLPPPLYPETAIRMRITGAVSIAVTVDENGKVIAARAVSGHMLLREAAISAARQAVFAPTLLHDKPVQVTGVIVYKFNQ